MSGESTVGTIWAVAITIEPLPYRRLKISDGPLERTEVLEIEAAIRAIQPRRLVLDELRGIQPEALEPFVVLVRTYLLDMETTDNDLADFLTAAGVTVNLGPDGQPG
jgi:hypothetical protein